MGCPCHRPVDPCKGFCQMKWKLLQTLGKVLAGRWPGAQLSHHLSHKALVTETSSIWGDNGVRIPGGRPNRAFLVFPRTWAEQGLNLPGTCGSSGLRVGSAVVGP